MTQLARSYLDKRNIGREKRLQEMADRLCKEAGIEPVPVRIEDNPYGIAYKTPDCHIVIHEMSSIIYDDKTLRAGIAHEIGHHVRKRVITWNYRLCMITKTVAFLAILMPSFVWAMTILAVAGILFSISRLVSQFEEFRCDKYACQLLDDPDEHARALSKLIGDQKRWHPWDKHPPLDSRIKKVMSYQN